MYYALGILILVKLYADFRTYFSSIRINAASIYAYIDVWKIGLKCFVKHLQLLSREDPPG